MYHTEVALRKLIVLLKEDHVLTTFFSKLTDLLNESIRTKKSTSKEVG